MRVLHIKKGAPEVVPYHPTTFYGRLSPEKQAQHCIAPNLWYWEEGPHRHGKYRCVKTGTIKTDKGMICGTHAKVYARRGWINPNHLREVIYERTQKNAERAKARLKCLRAGKCL